MQTQSHSPTSQEKLWRGDFGDNYTGRNAVDPRHIAALTANWARILDSTMASPPKSILEVGSNIGLNLRALRNLTDAEFYAVEPNERARNILLRDDVVPIDRILDGVCSDIRLPNDCADLAFTSGVLIHVNPDRLLKCCAEIHRVSRQYIACIEYFSDKSEQVPYRGQTEALFKRDFGSYYLDNFPDLRILDYGFAWRRVTGLDNLTWWIFEKHGG